MISFRHLLATSLLLAASLGFSEPLLAMDNCFINSVQKEIVRLLKQVPDEISIDPNTKDDISELNLLCVTAASKGTNAKSSPSMVRLLITAADPHGHFGQEELSQFFAAINPMNDQDKKEMDTILGVQLLFLVNAGTFVGLENEPCLGEYILWAAHLYNDQDAKILEDLTKADGSTINESEMEKYFSLKNTVFAIPTAEYKMVQNFIIWAIEQVSDEELKANIYKKINNLWKTEEVSDNSEK